MIQGRSRIGYNIENEEDVVLPVGAGECNGTDGDQTVNSNGKDDSGVSFGIVGENGSRSRGAFGQANEVKTFVEEVRYIFNIL